MWGESASAWGDAARRTRICSALLRTQSEGECRRRVVCVQQKGSAGCVFYVLFKIAQANTQNIQHYLHYTTTLYFYQTGCHSIVVAGCAELVGQTGVQADMGLGASTVVTAQRSAASTAWARMRGERCEGGAGCRGLWGVSMHRRRKPGRRAVWPVGFTSDIARRGGMRIGVPMNALRRCMRSPGRRATSVADGRLHSSPAELVVLVSLCMFVRNAHMRPIGQLSALLEEGCTTVAMADVGVRDTIVPTVPITQWQKPRRLTARRRRAGARSCARFRPAHRKLELDQSPAGEARQHGEREYEAARTQKAQSSPLIGFHALGNFGLE